MPLDYTQQTVNEILSSDGQSISQYVGVLKGKILHKMLPFTINGNASTMTISAALAKKRGGFTVLASKTLPKGIVSKPVQEVKVEEKPTIAVKEEVKVEKTVVEEEVKPKVGNNPKQTVKTEAPTTKVEDDKTKK